MSTAFFVSAVNFAHIISLWLSWEITRWTRDTTFPILPGKHWLKAEAPEHAQPHSPCLKHFISVMYACVCVSVWSTCALAGWLSQGTALEIGSIPTELWVLGLWPRSSVLRGQGLTSGPSRLPLRLQAMTTTLTQTRGVTGKPGRLSEYFL